MSSDGGDPAAWLALCRRAVEDQRKVFAEHVGIAGRTVYEGIGEGGDRSLVIDRLCEEAIFAGLEAHHRSGAAFTAISEERGEVAFGESETRVVIDPIDGSLNARRTIPSHCLSFAVAEGPTMDTVSFGYVYDFGAGEEFWAAAGQGAKLGDETLRVQPGAGLEIVGLEAAEPARVLPAVGILDDHVYRLRVLGSIAISLCYVAAGRFDGMIALRDSRSVDAAAGQLIAREAGAGLSFGGVPLEELSLGLDVRYPIAAARAAEDLPVLLEAQGAV